MPSNDSNSRYRTSRSKGNLFRTKGISVLHIDDEEDFLELTQLYIGEYNSERTTGVIPVTIDSLTDSEKAMEKLKETDYDAIISDYEMPSLNGLQLLELVRKESDIPFIILTGRGREEVVIEALNLGADYYIRKASDPKSLYRELLMVIISLARHKRTKAALKTSMRYHLLLFENSPACNLVIQTDGSISDVNRTVPKMLGYSREEMIGKQLIAFISTEERDWVDEKIKKALNGAEGPDKVFTLLTKSGERVKILCSGKHLLVEEGMLVTGIPLTVTLEENVESFISSK